ncbi:hypothetical protein A8A01_03285 [Ewingella americana]|nr:hypothetical protein A8A01_03285 [Ewingella americana]
MEDSDPVYDEACRMVGECCLMLAQNGEEVSRAQLAYQLKRVYWQVLERTDEENVALQLAIEQLEQD